MIRLLFKIWLVHNVSSIRKILFQINPKLKNTKDKPESLFQSKTFPVTQRYSLAAGKADNAEKKSPEKENQVEVFFFPDESNPATATETLKKAEAASMTTSTSAAAGVGSAAVDFDEADEDFCILGEEAGVGIMPRHGVPEVRWLCQESLRIVDNHFSIPLGKTDLLKAPKNFPPAVVRYTLCEMTLIWHFFGGKDFGDTQPVAKKRITINENSMYHGNYAPGR